MKNNAGSTVRDYVPGGNDDMKDLIDQALAGYTMVKKKKKKNTLAVEILIIKTQGVSDDDDEFDYEE